MQKGIKPWVAIPAANVTACCSAIPTSKVLLGNISIINLRELPVSIAGVIPIILSFCCANSTIVFPKTSWYLVYKLSSFLILSPENLLNFPGAWYVTWSSSACCKPLPFVVITCRNFGPFTDFNRSNSEIIFGKLWPSMGPE